MLAITITSSRDYLTVWSVDNVWTTFVGLGQHHWYSFQDGGYTSAAKYVTGFQSSIGTIVRVFCSSHLHESVYMGTNFAVVLPRMCACMPNNKEAIEPTQMLSASNSLSFIISPLTVGQVNL